MPESHEVRGPAQYAAFAGICAIWGSTFLVTSVSVGALIVPVLAVIVGAIVRGESPAPATYFGGAFVLAGVAAALFAGQERRNSL